MILDNDNGHDTADISGPPISVSLLPWQPNETKTKSSKGCEALYITEALKGHGHIFFLFLGHEILQLFRGHKIKKDFTSVISCGHEIKKKNHTPSISWSRNNKKKWPCPFRASVLKGRGHIYIYTFLFRGHEIKKKWPCPFRASVEHTPLTNDFNCQKKKPQERSSPGN